MNKRFRLNAVASAYRQRGNFEGIMSLFATKKPAAKGTPDPNAPEIDPKTGKPVVKQNDNSNPLDDIDPATGLKKKSQDNPLDKYKDLFQNKASGEDAPPSFNLDPAVLEKLTGSLNFAGQLDQEALEGLKSGDPEKITAILNGVGRNAYSTIMQHLPALTDKFVSARLEHANKGLGGQVKSTLTKQALDKLAANNPVLKQQMEAIGEQLLAKFPDASPDWIAEQTKSYFSTVAKMLDPTLGKAPQDPAHKPDPKDVSTREGFAWDKYLGSGPTNT